MRRHRDTDRFTVRLGSDLLDPLTGELIEAPVFATSRHYRQIVAGLEDRRRFSFPFSMPPASVRRSDRQLVVNYSTNVHGRATFHGLKFSVPERVALCAKRKIRREVMFAKGVGGGRGKRRPYRRNDLTEIGC